MKLSFSGLTSQALEMALLECTKNSQAQREHRESMKQSLPGREHRVVGTRHIEEEMYWLVKNEMMEFQRLAAPESLVNIATASQQQLLEEVHAYVMCKVTTCIRCGDKACAEPHNLQRFASQHVRAWCSKHLPNTKCKTLCAKVAQKPKLDPAIHYTTKQIHQMVIDEILSTGIKPSDGNSGAGSSARGDQLQHTTDGGQVGQFDSIVCNTYSQVSESSHHLPNSSSSSQSKAVKKRRTPKVVQFISHLIFGPKVAKVSSEPSSK